MANKNLLVAGVGYTSLVTTALDSLSDGSSTTASSAVDNTTALNLFADFSLMLGSINPSGAPYLECRMLELAGDGSTYDNNTAGSFVGSFVVTTGSSAKVATLKRVLITLGQFKIIVVNRTGVSLASSANALYYRTYAEQNNG